MISVDQKNSVVDITLNRPTCRNALSLNLLSELKRALTAPSLTGSTAVVISGAGTTFSAGADLSELTGTSKDIVIDDAIAAVVAAIVNSEIPVIAAVNGACIGGAVDIMLACDIRVASAESFFQVPATRLGLLYNPAAVARMHTQLPRDVLDKLLVWGSRFNAEEAHAVGLVTHVAPAHDLSHQQMSDHQVDDLSPAAVATMQLLDALDNGNYDPQVWEKKRRDILDSPERATAILAARRKMTT